MKWLYISLALVGMLPLCWIWLRKWVRHSNQKALQRDPDGYCDWLFQDVKQAKPKRKVQALQELFQLAISGIKPATVRLWRLLDSNNISGVHPQIITLLAHLGPAAVEAHVETTYRDEDGILYMAGVEGLERVYLQAGEVGLKRAEKIVDKYHKGHKRGLFLSALSVIEKIGDAGSAVKLLEDHDPYAHAKNNQWPFVYPAIRTIAERHPLPPEKGLHYDYLCAITGFDLDHRGAFHPDSTYGGGSHAEIETKRRAAQREISEERERIQSAHAKAREMLKENGDAAVKYFREEVATHLRHVY